MNPESEPHSESGSMEQGDQKDHHSWPDCMRKSFQLRKANINFDDPIIPTDPKGRSGMIRFNIRSSISRLTTLSLNAFIIMIYNGNVRIDRTI